MRSSMPRCSSGRSVMRMAADRSAASFDGSCQPSAAASSIATIR
jgi:hypothetical protein